MAREKKLEYVATPFDVLRMLRALGAADKAKVADVVLAVADFALDKNKPDGLDPMQQAICENWISYATRKKDNFQKAIERYEQKKELQQEGEIQHDENMILWNGKYITESEFQKKIAR